jgi:hypothetical protein
VGELVSLVCCRVKHAGPLLKGACPTDGVDGRAVMRWRQNLPMCLLSSLMKATQNLRISLSDLPLGSKSHPPLAPPMLTAWLY